MALMMKITLRSLNEYEDAYGSVTPDGKYFFFHTVDLNREKPDESFADVFWADADIIESLRPKK